MTEDNQSYGYGREKLYTAVNTLATGSGSLQERLESVGIGWIGLPVSFPDLLPRDLMPELKSILEDLSNVQGPNGAFRATTQAMSDSKAAELAERVLSLYINLRGGI